MHLTLLIPQLLWPEPNDAIALDGLAPRSLNAILARGRGQYAPPQSYESALAQVFGLDAHAPFGASRLAGEALQPASPDAYWMCADPIHLRFHQQRVLLTDASAFALDMAEAQQMASDLNRIFHDLGQFHVAHPRRWYLRLKNDPPEAASSPTPLPSLSAVAGRRMDGVLPDNPLAARVHRWQNEIQMFLHDHPVNLERANNGQPAINGLWFWGPGRPPRITPPKVDTVWTHCPLAAGLARLSGLKVAPAAHDLAAVMQHGASRHRDLVIINDLAIPAQHDDGQAWREALGGLERHWFAPLLKCTRIHQLEILAPTAFGQLSWTLNGGDRWKFWRRPTALTQRIRHLAEGSHP